jgi:hypothetical protein
VGEEINYFLLYFIDSAKTLWRRPRPTLCKEAPGGVVFSSIKTTPLEPGGENGNGSIMVVEMFVCLCLASQNLSEREFLLPPERT